MSTNALLSASDRQVMRYGLEGGLVAGVVYGANAAMYFTTLFLFYGKPSGHGRSNKLMATWSFLMFATATAHIGMGFHSTDYTFIDSSDPVASVYNGHLGLGFTIAFVINNFLADTLLIYRLFIIWGSKLLVVVIPSVVCLGAFVMSILEVRATVAASTTSEGDPNTINFGISYWSLTFSTNIIVSLLIAGRLLVYRHNLRKSFKDMASVGHDRAYLSIAAMIVESAALYTAVGLTFLGLFARHNAAQGFLVSILGQVEVLAPNLILLRVGLGISFSNDDITTLRTARFASKVLRPGPPVNVALSDIETNTRSSDVVMINQNKAVYSV